MKTKISIKTIIIMLYFSSICMIGCNNAEKKDTNSNDFSNTEINVPLKQKIDLHTAAMTGNIEMVKQHINNGTNLNEKEPMGGSTPLITATVFGKTEIAKLLIEAGADLNIQNNDGSTALHSAAFFCRTEIVKLLLKYDANKSIKNKAGATAQESVMDDFYKVKGIYDFFSSQLGPLGFKLDYSFIKNERPHLVILLSDNTK